MRERSASYFPFGIAVVLPPAGFILGLAAVSEGRRELGIRLMVTAVAAAVVWALLIVS